MPPRRSVLLPALVAVTAVVALTACSGGSDDGSDGGSGPSTPAATATPTATGDRPLVEVVTEGSGDRRRLALAPEEGSTDASLRVSQDVVTDQRSTTVPPVTVPFTLAVAAAQDDRLPATLTYARPTVDGTGLAAADVRDVRQTLSRLAGTSSTLTVRSDGTVVEATSGTDAATQVDAQVRELVPVLPSSPVGPGASWTVRSVVDVDGATVDQVATYTLESLEGDDYVISAAFQQTYRPGTVQDVEVRSGSGTVTARLRGSLARLLPDTATASVSSQVSYVVDAQVTEVRTTVSLDLTG